MEFRQYLRVMYRRRWVIVLTLACSVFVVALGTSFMKPVYSSTALVRIAQGNSGEVSYSELNYADRLMGTYVQLLKSRPFLDEVIKRVGLPSDAETLRASVKVEALANTELIRVSAESVDPNQATLVSNTLATLLVEERQRLFAGSGKSPIQILQDQMSAVEGRLAEDRSRVAQLRQYADPGQLGVVQELDKRISVEEQTYATLLTQFDKARLDEALQSNSVSVAEPAAIPDGPIRPNVPVYLALGALIGLLGGVGLAFVFENLDSTIHSADQLESIVDGAGVPSLLGWAPITTVPLDHRYCGPLPAPSSPIQTDRAFCALRVNLLSLTSASLPRAILITSAEPGAGKTTVTANLARAVAHAGRRVIVVDADAVHPDLHRLFDMPCDLGLGHVLTDGYSPTSVLQQTAIPGLKLMASGGLPRVSAESPEPHKMRAVMDSLLQEADLVLLDAPAVLTSPDVFSVATTVDGVLLVVSQGRSKASDLDTVLRPLKKMGAPVLGAVLNKARGSAARSQGYPARDDCRLDLEAEFSPIAWQGAAPEPEGTGSRAGT